MSDWSIVQDNTPQPQGQPQVATSQPQASEWSIVQDQPEANVAPQQPSRSFGERLGGAISNVVDTNQAFLSGARRGISDAALELGNLAGDLLSRFDVTKSTGEYIKSKTSTPLEPSAVEQANPLVSSIGAGLGYTGGMIAGPSKIVKGAGAVSGATKLADAAIHPAISGAIREGATGALQGAAMQPDNRGIGAIVGGVIGAPAGALGGLVSKGVQTSAREIAPELDRMRSLGFDVNSPEAIARARQELASRGEGQLQENIQAGITKQAENAVNAIKPSSANIPNKSPNQILTDRMKTQFAEVHKAKEAAYAPLNEATGLQNTTPIKVSANTLGKQGKNFLPDDLPKQANFSQLQEYRQLLDGSLKSAKNAAKNGNLSNKDLKNLYKLRSDVTDQMTALAERQGLGNQLAQAEDLYKNEYLPFRTFSKTTGKINTPEESDQVWHKINKVMAQTNPDPKELRHLVGNLGEEGTDLVGWGLLQNALTSAKDGSVINLSRFNTAVNKYRVGGLSSIISKPEYSDAVKGINRIIQDGKKAMNVKTNKLYIPVVSPVIEHLMQTKAGINLIVKLGSANKSSEAYRDLVQGLFTGLSNIATQKVLHSPAEAKPNE